MSELKIEIGANLKQLKTNIVTAETILSDFEKKLEEAKRKADENLEKAKELALTDYRQGEQAMREAQQMQERAQKALDTVRAVREEAGKVLAGDYLDPRQARNSIKGANRLLDTLESPEDIAARVAMQERELDLTRQLKEEREASTAIMKEALEMQHDYTENSAAISDADKDEMRASKYLTMEKRELVAEMRRLNTARKEAATRGETDEVARLTKEYNAARKALRSVNQQKQLAKILYLQQAQAAVALINGVKSLSGSVLNFSENAKKGSLDVSGLASSLYLLNTQIKAGLGPIGWLMLVVQGLAEAWNIYAKSQEEARKETDEAKKQIVSSTEAIKSGYDKARTAVDDFNRAQERTRQTSSALQYYKELNTTLDEHTRLINEDTAAELRRLAMTSQGEEHKDAMERLDLQNQLTAGMITQTEYDRRLLAMDEQKANLAKEQVVQQKQLAAAAADAAAKEAEAAAEAAKYRGKTSLAGWEQSSAEVKARETRIRELMTALQGFKPSAVTRAEEKVKSLTAYLEIIGNDPNMQKRADEIRQELNQRKAYLSQRTDIVNEIDRLRAQQPEYATRYGADEYAKEQQARQERQKAEIAEMDKLDAEANTRRVAANKASVEAAQAEKDAAIARQQNAETRAAREQAIATREQEEQANAESARKNEKLRAKVEQMSEQDLDRTEAYLQKKLAKTQDELKAENNLNERKRLEEKEKMLQQLEQSVQNKREQLLRQADQMLGTEGGKLAPGNRSAVSADLMKQLEEQYKVVMASSSATDDELLLRLINLTRPAVEAAARNQHEMTRLRSMIADLERKTKNLNR